MEEKARVNELKFLLKGLKNREANTTNKKRRPKGKVYREIYGQDAA